jgi:nucleotide-binding universal stress UspA family protein
VLTGLVTEGGSVMHAGATEVAIPDTDALISGGGSSFRRILVPVRRACDAVDALTVAARVCSSTQGVLRLVHVRIFDPPLRGATRFYPESQAEAAAVADEALPLIWGYGVPASTAVVEAQRREVATAIARHAAAWRADVIVMTRRPSLAFWRFVLGRIPDQVMRKAACPVLAVHPRPATATRRPAW